MKKKIISLSLASTLLMGTVACAASTNDKEVINETVVDKEVISEVAEDQSTYITHIGKISEVNKEGNEFSIIVDEKEMLNEGGEPSRGAINFNISEDVAILSDKTMDFVKQDKLVEGTLVEVSYRKDQPMTNSLPPMTNPDLVMVKEASQEGKEVGVKVETFDKDLVSSDNFLKFNVTKDTEMIDKDGKKLSEEDLYNKELVVFYGPAMTMSIPAQSNAVKVVALSKENAVETPEKPEKPESPESPEENTEIKSLDKIIHKGKEIELKNEIYKSGDTFMIPMREVGEGLGYELTWNSKANQAELTMGVNMVTTTLNEDMYSFSKMIVKLGKASEVKDGVTFVPASFLDKVMQLDVEVAEDGVINIK